MYMQGEINSPYIEKQRTKNTCICKVPLVYYYFYEFVDTSAARIFVPDVSQI